MLNAPFETDRKTVAVTFLWLLKLNIIAFISSRNFKEFNRSIRSFLYCQLNKKNLHPINLTIDSSLSLHTELQLEIVTLHFLNLVVAV